MLRKRVTGRVRRMGYRPAGTEWNIVTQTEKMNIIQTDIPGVVIIEPRVFGDERVYFM